VGDGNVHYNVLPGETTPAGDLGPRLKECEALLFERAAAYRGSISAEHGIGRTKRSSFLKTLPEVELSLMRGLKSLLDPQGLLAQGRVL
jgi:FAD/FMN-containing dehydrogenase